jgi:serine/threonine protein kinase
MAGLQVSLYQLTSTFGTGAYGTVWECRQVQTKERFAYAIVEARTCLDPEFLRHFENE